MKALQQFGTDIFQSVLKGHSNENVVLSTFSIYVALLMTGNGSNTITRDEFAQVLRIGSTDFSSVNRDLESVVAKLQPAFDQKLLSLANSLFIASGCRPIVRQSFLEIMTTTFKSEIQYLDFAEDPQVATDHINTWVLDKTNGKVEELIPMNVIDESTALVLVNAIYFKGDWKQKFDASKTRDRAFNVNKNLQIQVPTMQLQDKEFLYGSISNASWLHLPYTNADFSMVIVLPQKEFEINEIAEQVLSRSIPFLTTNSQKFSLVRLPKFKAEFALGLENTLEELGLRSAFHAADLSGITNDKSLKISSVIHKAVVQVDETGTVAAAATAFRTSRECICIQRTIEFIVDQPFMFLIVHVPSQTVLFEGKIEIPSA